MGRICLWELELPRFVLRGGRVPWLVKTLGTLSHTHLDILYAKTHCGLRRINCAAGLAQFGSVWLTLPLPRVAMPPGHAGINARKTARYTGKDCDPLQ